MREHYEANKGYLMENCDFRCPVDGRQVFVDLGAVESPFEEAYLNMRYQDAPEDLIWDKVSWYLAPELKLSNNFQMALQSPKFREAAEHDWNICAQAMPFMGKALNTA